MPFPTIRSRGLQGLLAAALSFALCGTSAAETAFALSIDEVLGDDWRAAGITIELRSNDPGQLQADIRVATLVLPAAHGSLRELHLACALQRAAATGWTCRDGTLALADSPLQAQDAAWQGSFRSASDWRLAIPRLTLGGGNLGLQAAGNGGQWDLRVDANRLALARIDKLAPTPVLPQGWQGDGRLSGQVRLQGRAADLSNLSWDLVADQVNFASPDDRHAAEALMVKTEGRAQSRAAGWRFDGSLQLPQGAVYSDPVFVDAGAGAVSAQLAGAWQAAGRELTLDSWAVNMAGAVDLSGTGRFKGPAFAVQDLTVVLRSDDVGKLYERLLQPFLIGTAADELGAAGRLGLVLHFDAAGIEQAGLDVIGLTLEDRQGRFSLSDVGGSVAWDRSRTVPVSRLEIGAASVYGIPTGTFSIRTQFAGDRVWLVEPVEVPVLDGRLALDSFALEGALVAGDSPRWRASASLRKVSLQQLTERLAWPPFAGTVDGRLTDMQYADRLFAIGGELRLQAFDGEILVNDLTLRDPLGSVPVLEADAAFRGLSLEALTGTFSFGRIEGRLAGDIRDIRLVGWEPDRFDLHFYTPDDDRSRHRISQRAVENLTELGSGVPAGLSSTVLRLFNDFGYDKIDLRILLRGSVAELDGLAREEGGYYLVRGAGLPRIDVIGRNRSVAWKDLIERLQQIQVEGAQIR